MEPLVIVISIAIGVVAVTWAAKSTRISPPVVLVAAGVLVALVPGVPKVEVKPELVLYVLLPPLLYSTAQQSSLIAIRASRKPIGVLAVGLVLATTIGVGVTAWAVTPEISLAAGIALGAIVSPPDAVAASAIARRSGLPRRMVTILEGESLFNDATSLVTLRVAVAAVAAGSASVLGAVGDFVLASVGGAAIGFVVGRGLDWIRSNGARPVVATALSVLTPFAVYLAADKAHTSGVIAVVVTGLVLAHRAPADQEPAARLIENSLWATVQFLLEGSVFVLIGLQLPDIVRGVSESAGTVLAVCGSVLAVALIVRPLWIFGLTQFARGALWPGNKRPPNRSLAVISWAGMRGVVSLAAAASLPLDFPRRDLLLLTTVVVIVGTLVLQGLTLPSLIRWSGITPPDPRTDALQVANAQEQAGRAAVERLDEMVAGEETMSTVAERLRRQVEYRTYADWERLGGSGGGEAPTRVFRRLRQEMVAAERAVLISLRDSGELDEEVLRQIQNRLDLEEALLTSLGEGYAELDGHHEILAPRAAPRCQDLLSVTTEVPVADPYECEDCVSEGRSDWVHLRACLACAHIACCDSSPRRHADLHWQDSSHPVMGSAETGESWRWCYRHQVIG